MASRIGGKLTLEGLKGMVAQRINRPGFENTMLKQLQIISGGEGKCCCKIKVAPDMLNVAGSLHGGVTAALVDAVSTYALTTTGTGQPGSSIDLSVSYLRPVKGGEEITISAETLRCGRSVAVCAVEVTNTTTGKMVAHGKHSKFVGEVKVKES